MLATIERAIEAPSEPGRRKAKNIAADLKARLAALPELSHEHLRAEWRRLYRANPPRKISRDVLELGIAWKLQERSLGGMKTGVKRRLVELADTMESKGDLTRTRTMKLKPGARLVREWRGESHDVRVLESGFLWRGQTWRSLSAIAREITGTPWSGPRFFGLGKIEGARRSVGSAAALAAAEEAAHA